MGYNTSFKGELKIVPELTATQIVYLKQFLGEDMREHPDWGKPTGDFFYINIELTKDYQHLKWDSSEKTYDMCGQFNFIIDKMREKWPEFSLDGTIMAQGEEIGDWWELFIDENDYACKRIRILNDKKIKCPKCGEEFVADGRHVVEENNEN